MFAQGSKIFRANGARRLITSARAAQRRNMGGGGAFMETNKFGENVGDAFGTIAWLWVFHRFRQDGAVLLGFQHPWEHGHDDHHAPSHSFSLKPKPAGDVKETWEKFSDRATEPGDDDDDDDDDDEDEE